MGLFRKKGKDIVVKQDISGYLVFPYVLKHDYLIMGKTVVVPENATLVVATRSKVLDILPTGKHTLNQVMLPRANQKFRLSKLDKNGIAPGGFNAYLYFVNMKRVQSFTFGTYKKLRYKNELDGKFWAKMQFVLTLQVADPELLLKTLLRQRAYLRVNEPEDIVENWLSEFVTNTLQKYSFRRQDFEKPRVFEMTELLGAKIFPLLENAGLELEEISLLEVDCKNGKKLPKNPLFMKNEVRQMAEMPPKTAPQEEFEEPISEFDEDFEDRTADFEDEVAEFEEFDDDFYENSTNFPKTQQKNVAKNQPKWLQDEDEENITFDEEDASNMDYDDSEPWQEEPEPDPEALENLRDELEEKALQSQEEPEHWQGWEKFLKRK